jgi:hypothetical protein
LVPVQLWITRARTGTDSPRSRRSKIDAHSGQAIQHQLHVHGNRASNLLMRRGLETNFFYLAIMESSLIMA